MIIFIKSIIGMFTIVGMCTVIYVIVHQPVDLFAVIVWSITGFLTHLILNLRDSKNNKE